MQELEQVLLFAQAEIFTRSSWKQWIKMQTPVRLVRDKANLEHRRWNYQQLAKALQKTWMDNINVK